MQRDVKVGLVLGVLLVGVVAVVFFRRDDEDRDKFSTLLPAPETVADTARDLLGPSTTDPYPVAPEYLADSWQSPKPPKSTRTPTPQRNKTAEPLGPDDEPETDTTATKRDPSRTAAVLMPPESMASKPSPRSKLELSPALGKAGGTEPATRRGNMFEYTIQEGDTLSDIATRYLGQASAWAQIQEANRDVIPDPDHIPVGQKIRIPSGQTDERMTPRPATTIARRTEPMRSPDSNRDQNLDTYVVQDGDTLVSIARRRYGRASMYLDIFNANQDQLNSPGAVRAGMVLRMPREHAEW
jgi:nucleoid-associated protein YgaU